MRKVLVQNALQICARGSLELQFMLLKKPQASPDDLGLIIKTAAADETVNDLLKMLSNHFAHRRKMQQF
jgi:hypothetical protein